MSVRWLLPVACLIAAGCGTSTMELAEEPDVTVPASTIAPGSTTTSTSTTTTATTSTSTTTTTTTTTSTIPPLAFDEDQVPVNGQSDGVLITPTGWRVPVLGVTDTGWRVWTPCGREAEVSEGTFVGHVDIVLDPGHGGREPGATGSNGLVEADLNLRVAQLAAVELETAGYSVLLTRTDDVRVPIVTRAEIALALEPIAFISIHHNAGTDAPSAGPGTEVFHQIESAESRRLAGILYEETVAVLRDHDIAWVSVSDAGALVRPNRDGADFYGVLRRPSDVTSVLSEAAYVSNGPEAELLARADVQDALASAIADAVERFVATVDPGSGFTDDPIFRGYESSGTGRTTNCDDPDLG